MTSCLKVAWPRVEKGSEGNGVKNEKQFIPLEKIQKKKEPHLT